MARKQPIDLRLRNRSERDERTGCLRWTGTKSPLGYGRMIVDGRAQFAHRVAYEAWVGPIPAGAVLDHVHSRGCRHRDCIEPMHLEPVAQRENLARASSCVTTINRAKTHCTHGHEFTEENTYLMSGGRRRCRTCQRRFSNENHWRTAARALGSDEKGEGQ